MREVSKGEEATRPSTRPNSLLVANDPSHSESGSKDLREAVRLEEDTVIQRGVVVVRRKGRLTYPTSRLFHRHLDSDDSSLPQIR